MNYTNTAQLGNEHSEWAGKLDFYKNDLDILRNRLAEIASKNSNSDARAGIEHFQNQFIIQRNNIDELRHSINETAHQAFVEVKDHAGHVSISSVAEYKKTTEDINAFEKVINELRREFQIFSAKWM
jgi:hypothetical protein